MYTEGKRDIYIHIYTKVNIMRYHRVLFKQFLQYFKSHPRKISFHKIIIS